VQSQKVFALLLHFPHSSSSAAASCNIHSREYIFKNLFLVEEIGV
jgi:hypothetical protein